MDENDEKAFNAPPLTKYLVAGIILIHILLLVTDESTFTWIYDNLAVSIDNAALVFKGTGEGSIGAFVFTLTSHIFLHHDFMHVLINAFMLLAFGAMIERYYGVSTFVTVFLLSAWAGALAECWLSRETGGILYGASGAVFGMMGATMRLMLPRFGMQKIIAFAAVMMGLNLVIGLTPLGTLITGGDASVSWAAHLAGFAMGTLLSLIFKPRAIEKS